MSYGGGVPSVIFVVLFMISGVCLVLALSGALGCQQTCASDASGPLTADRTNLMLVTGNGFRSGGSDVTLTWINPPNGTLAGAPTQCGIGIWWSNSPISTPCFAPPITPTNSTGGLELLVTDSGGDAATVWFSVVQR